MTAKKENKFLKPIIGLLLILIGVCIFGYDKVEIYKIKEDNNKNIRVFFEEVKGEKHQDIKSDYIAVVKIDKINLETGLVSPDSKLNDVSKHIQILDESDMPDVIGGNLILASHSGNSKVSYFKNLHKLVLTDKIKIYYDDYLYTYEVINKYKIDKDGTVEFGDDKSKTILVLTTCDVSDDTKQLVVISKQINKEKIDGRN